MNSIPLIRPVSASSVRKTPSRPVLRTLLTSHSSRCASLHPLHELSAHFIRIAEMAQRVTLRKRTPYNTTSNRRRVVKTPGGKLVYHHLKKARDRPQVR